MAHWYLKTSDPKTCIEIFWNAQAPEDVGVWAMDQEVDPFSAFANTLGRTLLVRARAEAKAHGLRLSEPQTMYQRLRA